MSQHFEEPDMLVVHVTTEEEIDLESILGVTAQAVDVFSKRSDVYWLNFLGKGKGFTVEARKGLRKIPILNPYAYVGIGGSLPMRALVSILLRGVSLVGRLNGKIVIFATEEDARKWVAEDRIRRASAKK